MAIRDNFYIFTIAKHINQQNYSIIWFIFFAFFM